MDVLAQLYGPAPLAAGSPGISMNQLVMFILAVIGLTILMRSTYSRSKAPKKSAKQRYESINQRSKANKDVEAVIIELDRVARQIHGRIDTKYAKLEAVIRHADDRIEELSRLLRAAEGQPTLDTTVGNEPLSRPTTDVTPTTRDRHADIFELADKGLRSDEIGRQIGKTKGEVELILALRRTKAQSAAMTQA